MAEPIYMIALSPTMETGQIVKWQKKEGEQVNEGDVLCDVETDKASMEYESTEEGTLLKILIGEGGEAGIGTAIAILGEKGEDFQELLSELSAAQTQKPAAKSEPEAKEETTQTTAITQTTTGDRVKASPLARKIAEDNSVDLASITGTGPQGRIIKRDVEKAMSEKPARAAAVAVGAPGVDQEIPLSGKRKVIAQRLAESKFTAPHYYVKLSVNMDNTMRARKELNARAKEKVSMNAFLLKFIAEALGRHAVINSSWQGDKIIQFGSVDIGLAVAQPDGGLITPVVRNCKNKGILAIDQDLKDLIDKARNNKLKPEEYTGATFTLSSLGSFGVEEFTAIINPPGAAILAIGTIQKTPVVVNGDDIEIQSLMKMSLSCDHRVIDGAMAARFLKDLKDMMEDPIRTLL